MKLIISPKLVIFWMTNRQTLRRQSGVRWNAKSLVVVGQVERVNRSAGEWGLLTDHGVKTGKVAPAGPDLGGLQVGKRYRFNCAEVTESDALCRDRKMLYLQSIETA